jgi:pimeloyl-ACP methyl ester carboxylesterase
MSSVVPYTVEIPESALSELRERLKRTRWPEPETVNDWSQGVPLRYLQELCEYWALDYDWRQTEARLNAVPQFRTEIAGLQVHLLHARSRAPDALPLLITHGWPGSVIEFLKVIGPLSDPTSHGGDALDSFHVVCPSLPGYGFSEKPSVPGWGVERIAEAWVELMSRLGYERFGIQGGDWGAAVAQRMASDAPEHVAGVHLNMPSADPAALQAFDELTDQEESALASFARFRKWESGYSKQQATRPQTLGYGLLDSPAAQCAWIVEKFYAWTDCGGHPENVLTRDEMLDDVMLYWLPGTGASSARLYWESFGQRDFSPIGIPSGCSIFPKEILRISERWARTRFTDLRYWNELERGGHFACLEQPQLFVEELRAFFRIVR